MMLKKNSEGSLKCFQNKFSHIYVEKDVINNPAAVKIMNRFPKSKIIEIENYKDVFNRPRQSFLLQKKSQSIILANKRYDFLYKGSSLCEDFGEENFYYLSCILNCIYDCEYCYLQGMYPSSNIVVFVNIEDFFNEVIKESKDKRIYLCISYDSDMLALEDITGYTAKWIEFVRHNKNVLIEIRTKSVNYKSISSIKIPENVILAWTLSPDEIVDKYEYGTPSLEMRLKDIKLAASRGNRVRISIEPVVKIDNFEKIYGDFIDEVFSILDRDSIRDLNIGVFRMSKEHFKRISKIRENSELFCSKISIKNGIASYEDEKYMKEFIIEKASRYIEREKIY